MPEGRAWEMGLKAAAHEQRMAGWCIGMPCEHYVCDCESVTCGVRVATPTLAWCADSRALRSRDFMVLQISPAVF